MKLSELNNGDSAKIVRLEASSDLKSRLASFGVVRGVDISIEACSTGKRTMEILVDDNLIGIRASEAAQIEVDKYE